MSRADASFVPIFCKKLTKDFRVYTLAKLFQCSDFACYFLEIEPKEQI